MYAYFVLLCLCILIVMYVLFCVLCFSVLFYELSVCKCVLHVLLPPGVYPTAVNKYIMYQQKHNLIMYIDSSASGQEKNGEFLNTAISLWAILSCFFLKHSLLLGVGKCVNWPIP